MSNELISFENKQLGKVRTVLINDEPWFVGKDVTDILGYKNNSRDINRHVDEDDRQNYRNGSFKTPRGVTIINESGLYSLILLTLSGGRTTCKMQTEWTQKGRLFLYKLLKKHGIIPMIERDDTEAQEVRNRAEHDLRYF